MCLVRSVIAWTFPAGKLWQDVTSVTLVNNTAKTVDIVSKNHKRILILNIKATNPDNVARDITLTKYKETAKTNIIKTLYTVSRNAGATLNWPNSIAAEIGTDPRMASPCILEYTNKIAVVWGAGGVSAGGVDADGLVVEYLELDVEET